jgi:hypothetical protein
MNAKNSYRLNRKVHCEEQVLPGAVQIDRQLNLPRLLAYRIFTIKLQVLKERILSSYYTVSCGKQTT